MGLPLGLDMIGGVNLKYKGREYNHYPSDRQGSQEIAGLEVENLDLLRSEQCLASLPNRPLHWVQPALE
jgi:hypothetical protein